MAIIRRVTRIANPRKAKARTRRKAVKARHRRRVTRNPVLLEFGVLNPRRKRRISVAKRHRKHRRTNPRRHAVARVHHRRHRRRNTRVYNRHHRRRRNPGMMNKAYIEQIGGALLGFGLVRALPGMIPTSVTGLIPPTSFTPALVSGISTAIATWAAHKFGGPNIATGVAIAGGALTASQVLTAMGVPSTIGSGSTSLNFGVNGLGDIVATQGFAVPDRAMRAPIPIAAAGVGNYRRRRY